MIAPGITDADRSGELLCPVYRAGNYDGKAGYDADFAGIRRGPMPD
jgi:hypothetical protein